MVQRPLRFRYVSTIALISLFYGIASPTQSFGQSSDMASTVGPAVMKAAGILATIIVEKEIVDTVYDRVTGRLNKDEMERYVQLLIKRDSDHSARYAYMLSQLSSKMSRSEAEAIMMNTLNEIDPVLAEHTRKIRELQAVTDTQRQLVENLRKDSAVMSLVQQSQGAAIQRQAEKTSRLEAEFEEMKKAYPRYRPGQQAQMLGASGMIFLREGNNKEAMRAFRFAHAFDPNEAGFLYGLAVAHRRDGQTENAEMLLARGIVAERQRSMRYSEWWRNTIGGFQGPDRLWLEDARRDPIYGVYVRGLMRVPVAPSLSK